MNWLASLFLGFIQGLTEFFPISSSAHLKLAKMAMGIQDVPIIFDLSCHLGTLFALLVFFKNEIIHLFKSEKKKLVYLFLALIPLIPSYFFLSSFRKVVSDPKFLGLFLCLTSLILFLGQRIRIKKTGNFFRDVLLIGTMQSAALFPGVSRSASTISTATALGWKTKEAVRFSFLLAIPTILGGSFLEIEKLWEKGQMLELINLYSLTGFLTSFIIGLFTIRFAINWLEKGKYQVFAWYCLILGILVTAYVK